MEPQKICEMEPQKICDIEDDTQGEEPGKTYNSELVWKVHYVSHERRNQNPHHNNHASLETSLEDFHSDEEYEDDVTTCDDNEGETDYAEDDVTTCDDNEGETDYATDYAVDGDDEGDGGNGYETSCNQDTATEIISDSDESGCETEVSLKASEDELYKMSKYENESKDEWKEEERQVGGFIHPENIERADNLETRVNNYSEAQIDKKVNRKESQVLIIFETETDDENSDVGETDVCGFSDSDCNESGSDTDVNDDSLTVVEHQYKTNREENISRSSTVDSQEDDTRGARPKSRLSSSGDSLSNKSQRQNGNSKLSGEKRDQQRGNCEMTLEKQPITVEIEEKSKERKISPASNRFRRSIENYSRPQMNQMKKLSTVKLNETIISTKTENTITVSNKVKDTKEEPPGIEIVQKRELPHTPPDLDKMKSRIQNLKRIIDSKNEEIKELKNRLKVEKEQTVADGMVTQEDTKHINKTISKNIELDKLRCERASLRQEKEALRTELRKTSYHERHQSTEFRRTQLEQEKKLKLAAQREKREQVREAKAIQEVAKKLNFREKELLKQQRAIHKLECEKLYLGEEIFRLTGVEEGFWSDETLSRPLLTEKERCLVRRNSTLNTQLSRIQINCKLLGQENNKLKNKMEVEFERPFDLREKEKTRLKEVQKLKRKNQDLATITRKLEEKVKSLEKKTKESPSTERRNKLKEKQKEKEVEYEKQLMARDQEIQKLKNRMKDLVRKLTGKNGEITRAQSTLELEHIIRTVTKERLQLERHLAVATEGLSSKGPGEAEALRVASLEETNKTLESQLGDLDLLTRQHHTLEKHVHDKDLECVTLKEKLKLKNELCQDLECQLARVIQKNTALTIQNSDLQKQIQELQHVSEECRSLKHTLNTVETDWSSTKLQVGQLHGNVATLESVLRQMKEAAEKRRDLERQHAEAQQQLREKQALVNELSHRPGSNANEWERKAQQEAIASLQSKIRELEKLGETQNLRHEELLLEMQSLKKAQGSPKNSWSRSGSLSADLQSPDSGDVTPGLTSLNSLSSGIYTATTTSSSVIYDRSGRHSPNHTHHHHGGPPTENVSSEIDRIMAKIAQDNKILEELDKSRSTIDKNLVNGNIPGVIVPSYETDNRVLDVLEIPGKGRCHVYIARYSYDPFQHSPNENPEAELAVNAGDYVLVWGSMDEVAPRTIDGFFDGELLDGRRGLVPSNFVEKLIGEDLIEFHQSVVMGLRDGDESVSTSVPQDLDFISQDDSQMLIDIAFNQTRQNAYTSYLDLEDIIEEEEEPLTEHVPPPVQLTLERQLNKSIVIGWNPPPEAAPGSIEFYHVYVNGLLKTTVKSTDRTRALVEGVDSTRLHRISVRSVTPHRRTSRDAACTMIIGKDAPTGPTNVKASSITSTSAIISWLPSNSNFQHTVCVNNVEVRTVKPGVYRHTITGLSPNTTYRVTIRSKNLRAPQFDEKQSRNQDRLSTTIEFRTLPKGLPDPPVDVQVEAGPQDGSLLVTWLPVTINSLGGTSNGAPVTGYAVYADGKKVTEVESPTGDHALIDLTKIPGFDPKQVTVRTKSRESVSGDSVPSQIPTYGRGRGRGKSDDEQVQSDLERPSELSDIAEESETEMSDDNVTDSEMHGDPHKNQTSGPAGVMRGLFGGRGQRTGPPGSRVDHLGQTILDHEDNMSDKEIYPHGQSGIQQQQQQHQQHQQGTGNIPSIEITKDPASDSHDVYPEDEYDMGPAGRGRYDSRNPPRTHLERGRPPAPPHATQGRPMPRDPRNPQDPRDPHFRDPRDNRRDPRDTRNPNDRYEGEGRHGRDSYGRDGYREAGGPGGRGGRAGEHTRIFVALFDYDPPTMSPNPDACDEELGFREGQLIKVFGDKDPDGFYWGEASGRSGYVPCNMVSEVQVDDDRVAQELLKESDAGRRKRDGSIGRRVHQGDRWGDIYANMPVRKMIAMYDYDPQELSPNVDSEVELSFQTGDIIYVYGDMDDDGFYMGELRGQRGLVPSNFLQDAPQDYNDEHRSRRDNLDPRDRGMMNQPRGPGPGAHGPPPPPRPDQRDRRKGHEGAGGPAGPMGRGAPQRTGERW